MPPQAGSYTPVMAGLCMAGTSVLVSGPVGYLLRFTGRVKLLLPVTLMTTSLLLTLLLLDETRSRDAATYFVIGCVWSVCDSCFQVCFTGWLTMSIFYTPDLHTPSLLIFTIVAN